MNNNINVLKQLNTMVLITIITQIFMLVKNAIVASYFGISAELDAFNLANNIAIFVYSFIGAGVSTVIIPYLRDKINNKGINIFISVIYTFGFILLLSIIIFSKEIITIATSVNDFNFISLASNLLIFTAITGFVNAFIQLAKGILEFNDRFNTQKLLMLFSNVFIVLLLLTGYSNIYYYATVLLLAATTNLLLHVFFVWRTNFQYRFSFDLREKTFNEMLILFLPTMLSTGVYQISLLIDTLIAARLPIGSISLLNYSNSVISMINLLLLANITSFVYPKLVKKNNNKERQVSLIDYILLVSALMSLIIVLFFTSGHDGIAILFERGKFTEQNTSIVYIIALILVLSLPTNAIRDLLYRYFYMNKDTFTPFVNSIVISILNILISLILSKYLGLYGVVIGTVLASYLSLFSITLRFKKKFPIYFIVNKFIIEILKIISVTGLTLIVTIKFKDFIILVNPFISLIVHGTFSLVVFIVLLKLFNSRVFKLEL